MIKLALLIGIDRYESEDFDNLTLCEGDAKDMDKQLNRHWSRVVILARWWFSSGRNFRPRPATTTHPRGLPGSSDVIPLSQRSSDVHVSGQEVVSPPYLLVQGCRRSLIRGFGVRFRSWRNE